VSAKTTPQYIGLDVGTTSLKGALIDASGTFLAIASVAYGVSRPRPGWSEQDPADYESAAIQCIRQLIASPHADPSRIAALCSSGQAPTLVLLDRDRKPIRPAILWQDTRAAAEAAELSNASGSATLHDLLGMRWPVDASWPLARGRWLARHEPGTIARLAHILLPKDYVHFILTGSMRTDAWSAKGLVHQGTMLPISGMRDLGNLPPEAVPDAGTPRDVVGTITAEIARATGLPPGLRVVCGWSDAMAAMLGSGAFGHPGTACDVSGTSEVAGVTVPAEAQDTGPLMTARIVDTGRWILYGPTQASGASLGWIMRTVDVQVAESAPDARQAAALALAATIEPGAGGLTFLPYLEGERAPIWNPHARGAFTGLSISTEPGHLIRAVLEGVACSVRHILEYAVQYGHTPIREVRIAGGGARAQLWNQIKADLTGLTFRPCATTENGVLGSAMLGAVGVGDFADLSSAGDSMVHLGQTVHPDPASREIYDQLFRRYVGLYPAINAQHL